MNLTEFLLDRVTEDEATARMAAESADYAKGASDWTVVSEGKRWVIRNGNALHGRQAYANKAPAQHIARFDPARVLADCAAKRTIVGELERITEANGFEPITVQVMLCALARPYADHVDYDEDWRP